MRLSEAIALGRTLLTPTAGGPERNPSAGKGCAIQLALVAVGKKEDAFSCHGPDFLAAEKIFGRDIVQQVWPEFDRRFCCDDANLDEFIDWVRSIEPPDVTKKQLDSTSNYKEALVNV